MKRKQCSEVCIETKVSDHTRSKNPQLSDPLPPTTRPYFWVSGTSTRNYILRDPIIDWFKLTRKDEEDEKDDFFQFILNRGNEFETRLVNYIHTNKIPVVSVSDKITQKTCKQTIDLMKQGVPIIHSAPFKNGKEHIRGVIDLLVRSDHLSSLVDDDPNPSEKRIKAPNLNGNYHYVVIDVKFSTLPLRADGKHLLNSGSYPAYKSQIWIYTKGIGLIQGYTSRYGYILGRRWNYTSKGERFSGLNCLNKLGTIDFQDVDSQYVERTKEAMEWLNDLKKNGKKWSVSPPSRPELYPNMCVESGTWDRVKAEIADEIGEITSVWYVGNKHRNKAIEAGITSWRDPNCNTQALGLGGVRGPVIDKILDINRQNRDNIRPSVIETNLYNWKEKENEMFVDFETFTDIFADMDSLPAQPRTTGIFMIGVYYKDRKSGKTRKTESEWKYKNFICNSPTREEEFRIMNEFVDFVEEQGRPKLWYWHAEKTIWKSAENRQLDHFCEVEMNSEVMDRIVDEWNIDADWADMADLFRSVPIVLKGCFKFGLKAVASAMRDHGMIETKINSECDNGLNAAVKAWQTYQEDENPSRSETMNDIAKYNRFDVEVLYEILEYLRNNHSA